MCGYGARVLEARELPTSSALAHLFGARVSGLVLTTDWIAMKPQVLASAFSALELQAQAATPGSLCLFITYLFWRALGINLPLILL